MTDTSMKCLVWRTAAKSLATDPDEDLKRVNSPRAGGCYEISASASAMLKGLSNEDKLRLTTWIVDENRLGSGPAIDSGNLEKLSSRRPLSVVERRDRLLMYFNKTIERLGTRVLLHGLETDQICQNYEALLAWTESLGTEEVDYLLQISVEDGLVREVDTRRKGYDLSGKGYVHLEELQGKRVDSAQAFVAMWLDSSMDKAWEKGIAEAIRQAGYRPLRIDQKEHVNKIDDEIIAEIRRSRFLVADFTSEPDKPRGGVYFEAGFAQGLNIPVIWTCRDNCISHVHFDTRQFNHIVWSTPDDLRTKLKVRIEAVIGDGPHKPESMIGVRSSTILL